MTPHARTFIHDMRCCQEPCPLQKRAGDAPGCQQGRLPPGRLSRSAEGPRQHTVEEQGVHQHIHGGMLLMQPHEQRLACKRQGEESLWVSSKDSSERKSCRYASEEGVELGEGLCGGL